MKQQFVSTAIRSTSTPMWCARVIFTSLVLCSFAHASLGGALDSVQADQVEMKATIKVHQTRTCAVHEMLAANGTTVREYVSESGRVFGVAWQGPFIPDMRQLLGSYFSQFSVAAKAQRESHVGRWPLNIQEPGLVVQTAGHMRAFSGRAYDPELLPAGVSADAIQ
jgi:hypothetical protein